MEHKIIKFPILQRKYCWKIGFQFLLWHRNTFNFSNLNFLALLIFIFIIFYFFLKILSFCITHSPSHLPIWPHPHLSSSHVSYTWQIWFLLLREKKRKNIIILCYLSFIYCHNFLLIFVHSPIYLLFYLI